MSAPSERIRAIDWLRGLAVFVMIEVHALILLSKEFHGTPLRDFLNGINGLVAPSFLFAAGFALTLVMARAAKDPAAARARSIKSLRRIAEVLLVGKALTAYFHWNEKGWWLASDVLSCIALSLLVVWVLLQFLADRPRVYVVVATVLGLFCLQASTWCSGVTHPVWSHFVNPPASWEFGVLPWAGYVLLGAAAGAISTRGLPACAWALAGVALLGAWLKVTGVNWQLENAGERLVKFGSVGVLLCAAERFAPPSWLTKRNPVIWLLELYGQNSMTAYAGHLLLLAFPIARFAPVAHWYERASWELFWGCTVYLWIATALLCWGIPKLTALLPWNRKPVDRPPRPA